MNNVLNVINSIHDISGKPPCKKTIHKMIYLIQEAENGVDLGFDYSIYFYGPYSKDLNAEISYLYRTGEVNIEVSRYEHKISVAEGEHSEATTPEEPILEVIRRFADKKPVELELITTTLYIKREAPHATDDETVNYVIKVKGSKYPVPQIKSAINELRTAGYFAA